ncbi:hypothetical protein BGZ58_004474, partial [Dissophora ornata]
GNMFSNDAALDDNDGDDDDLNDVQTDDDAGKGRVAVGGKEEVSGGIKTVLGYVSVAALVTAATTVVDIAAATAGGGIVVVAITDINGVDVVVSLWLCD